MTPFAEAWKQWRESPEGQRCLVGNPHSKYLENRLNNAFAAGWNAAEARVKATINVVTEPPTEAPR